MVSVLRISSHLKNELIFKIKDTRGAKQDAYVKRQPINS